MMELVIVTYRQKEYPIDIDTNQYVPELKKAISKLTGLKSDRFSLKLKETITIDTKPISYYTKYGHNFLMINVSIDVSVVFNGVDHKYYVPELRRIDRFIENILRSSGHDTEISLYYKEKKLSGLDTFVSSGVEHGATLTAVNGKLNPNVKKKIKIFYRIKSYPIEIEQSKTVLQLKEVISAKTGIMTEHFCLKLGLILLKDDKTIADYVKDGTDFVMVNVTIKVRVIINGKEVLFYVKEETKIDDFRRDIISQSNISSSMYLYYNYRTLNGTKTILSSGMENNCVVFAVVEGAIISDVQNLTVAYRDETYPIEIESTKLVRDLKEVVSSKSGIESNKFNLQIYWLILDDKQPISVYMKYGSRLSMTNVIIEVSVKMIDRVYNFSVNENTTIDEFKRLILDKIMKSKNLSHIVNNIHLSFCGSALEGDNTLLSYEVENESTIMGVPKVTGG